MKRTLCFVLAVVMAMTFVVPVMAAVSEPPVSPQYTYIQRLNAGLTINEATGLTSCTAGCFVVGANSVTLTSKLQRYNGSSWTTVKTWTTTTTQSAALNKNYAVYSGYTYRVRVSCSVYNSSGTLLESGICYSHQVEY